MEDLKHERVALVVVHGVAAHPRYEFQDQCAELLRDRLNEREGDEAWRVGIINPGNVLQPGDKDPEPTISRVYRGADPEAFDGPTFDVIEAYWSPITKRRTNWISLINWILRIVFTPFNTTARYDATWQKQLFDYGFIGGTMALAFALFVLSLTGAWESLVRIGRVTGLLRQSDAGALISALDANASVHGIPIKIGVWLVVGIVGGFLLGQAFAAIWKTIVQRRALARNRIALLSRILPIGVLLALGGAFVYEMATVRFPNGTLGLPGIGFLVTIFVAFQLGYALLVGFVVDFFGDVQIYTTRDENDSTFYQMRDAILDTTVAAIARAVSPQLSGGRRYDRVLVLAHSLGATIAADALVRLYQLSLQGALRPEEFARIRAFAMLGSSLEKTKYFFDVQGASTTASFERWSREVYEELFTADPAALRGPNGGKIFWCNYWYFQDPICNEIRSYDARRELCRNERGRRRASPMHPMLHSDYLYDPWVWNSRGDEHVGLLDIVTAHLKGDVP